MLINTPDGWKELQSPTPSIREAVTDERRLICKMADELTELCPSLAATGAQMLAATLAKSIGLA